MKLAPCEKLGDVYRALTGNAQIESMLGKYCQRAAADWEAAWTGQNPAGREYDLAYYVPALYALLKPEAARKAGQRLRRSDGPLADDDNYQAIDGETEEDRFAELMRHAGNLGCAFQKARAQEKAFSLCDSWNTWQPRKPGPPLATASRCCRCVGRTAMP